MSVTSLALPNAPDFMPRKSSAINPKGSTFDEMSQHVPSVAEENKGSLSEGVASEEKRAPDELDEEENEGTYNEPYNDMCVL